MPLTAIGGGVVGGAIVHYGGYAAGFLKGAYDSMQPGFQRPQQ